MSSRSEKVGEYISEAMERVGNDGVITIEESRGMETELEVVEGMSSTVVLVTDMEMITRKWSLNLILYTRITIRKFQISKKFYHY